MNSDKMIQAAEVLDVLVKKLPDEALQEYFQVASKKRQDTFVSFAGDLAAK